jgi:hypothetical protein
MKQSEAPCIGQSRTEIGMQLGEFLGQFLI